MTGIERVDRRIRRYRDGIYLPQELFLVIALETRAEEVETVLEKLPDDLSAGFRDWVREYMLEGGIPVGSGPVPMPSKQVMIRFKAAVDRESTGADKGNGAV